MDKGKIKTDANENRTKEVWKTIGVIALSVFLALLTVVVINV